MYQYSKFTGQFLGHETCNCPIYVFVDGNRDEFISDCNDLKFHIRIGANKQVFAIEIPYNYCINFGTMPNIPKNLPVLTGPITHWEMWSQSYFKNRKLYQNSHFKQICFWRLQTRQ